MHLFHKWPAKWDAPVLMGIGFSEKLGQRRECVVCGSVQYRTVYAGTAYVHSKERKA